MSLSTATFEPKFTVHEVLSTGISAASSNKTVKHLDYFASQDLATAGGDTVVVFTQAMSGGAATIDLAVLTGTGGGSVSLVGKKIYGIGFRSTTGNSNPVTVKENATEGFEFSTGDNWTMTMKSAGDIVCWSSTTGSETIASDTNDKIGVSGTLAQSVDVIIVAG